MSVPEHFDQTTEAVRAFPLTPAGQLRAAQFAVWGRKLAHHWSSLFRGSQHLPAHAPSHSPMAQSIHR